MARYIWDETTGARYWQDDQGGLTLAPETSDLEAAGIGLISQLNRYRRGLQNLSASGRESGALDAQQREEDAMLAAVRRDNPVASFVGGAVPALATAPIGGAGVLGNLAVQTGVGAIEGAIDYRAGRSMEEGAAIGAAGGVVGDLVGRVLSRAARGVAGFAQDVSLPRPRAATEAGERFEELGGRTLAYQRMPEGRAQALAERMAQGAQASINPPTVIRETAEANDKLFRDMAIRATGGDPAQYSNLGPEFIDQTLNRFNQQFEAVADAAGSVGDIRVGKRLGKIIARTRQVKELQNTFGEMEGLEDGVLTGAEWVIARQGLAEEAAAQAGKGYGSTADRYYKLIDEIDDQVASQLPDEFLPDYARLREQYRVFSLLERPNVINARGEINVGPLNRALRSRASGFGRTATRGGGGATNPETEQLIELARVGSSPEFQAFKSSGTAENLALDNALRSGEDAVLGLAQGDPRAALGFTGRLLAPGVIGAAEAGGGRTYSALMSPAGPMAPRLGAAAMRGGLDQALFPFVGVENDIQP